MTGTTHSDKKPDAKNDTDMVFEGGGTTSGNVILGGPDPDSDPSKKGVQVADYQGDGPAIIRCIIHDDIKYELNSSKTAVSASGGTPPGPWSYNNSTGELTITTELGGTLKINLDGPGTKGAYTYTAPASVEHVGFWGLPANDPDKGFGDSLDTWLDRFDDGITITGLDIYGNVANIGKKDVSFTLGGTQYKYGGIGVDANGDRDAEVDFVDGKPDKAESLKIEFDVAQKKVTVCVAALFGPQGGQAAPYDDGNTEVLLWKAYDSNGSLIGSGTVLGDRDGLKEFSIEIAGKTIKNHADAGRGFSRLQ